MLIQTACLSAFYKTLLKRQNSYFVHQRYSTCKQCSRMCAQYNTVYKYLRKHLLSLKDKVPKIYEHDFFGVISPILKYYLFLNKNILGWGLWKVKEFLKRKP